MEVLLAVTDSYGQQTVAAVPRTKYKVLGIIPVGIAVIHRWCQIVCIEGLTLNLIN